jgi:hypothetical protein
VPPSLRYISAALVNSVELMFESCPL